MDMYSSHNGWVTYYELIEIEVKERKNYKRRELDRVLKDFCSQYKDGLYKWVTPNPNIAYSYLAPADDYDDITSRTLTESEMDELYVYHDFPVVAGIDDGDEGVLILQLRGVGVMMNMNDEEYERYSSSQGKDGFP